MRPFWLALSLLLQPLSALSAEPEASPPEDLPVPHTREAQDTDQLYSQAIAALSGNQPDLARQLLERAVAARPRFPAAWLYLAIATYRSGDAVAAVEHLEYLRTQFKLPPVISARVDHWHQLWQNPAQAAPPQRWQGELQLGLGHDNNANTGLASAHIVLSTPSGNALFDVDKAYLPRSDQFGLLALSLQGPAQPWKAGSLNPVVRLRTKQPRHEREFATLDLQSGLTYQRPASGGGAWQAHASVQHYQLGGKTLFNGLRLVAQRIEPWHNCQWTAQGEYENRRYQRVASLGGQFLNLSAGLVCPTPARGAWGILLKAGAERARFDRPGGDNRTQEIQLSYEQPLSPTLALQANWQHSRLRDESGYSPLMQGNAVRHVKRHTVVLTLRHTLNPDWEARLNYEHFQQRANLPLFEQRGSLLTASLAYLFR